jgi:hypothetical protein
MYEMLVGFPPFYSDDPMTTCRKVINPFLFESFILILKADWRFQVLHLILVFLYLFGNSNVETYLFSIHYLPPYADSKLEKLLEIPR